MNKKLDVIYRTELLEEVERIYHDHYEQAYDQTIHDIFNAVRKRIRGAAGVDAVPVNSVIFHHILIDNNGVPEVKLQLGDRILTLRADPIDVRQVVHGEWLERQEPIPWCEDDTDIYWECSACGCHNCGEPAYCPNCGAKMGGNLNG